MITIFKEHGEYVATEDDCLVHAFGATPEEARAELLVVANEQYRRLRGLHHVGRLGKHLAATIPNLANFLAQETV